MNAVQFIGDGSLLTDIDASAFDFSGKTVLDELVLKTTNNEALRHGLSFQNSGDNFVWDIHRTAAKNLNDHNSSLIFAGGDSETFLEALSPVMALREDGLVFIGSNLDEMVSSNASKTVRELKLPDGDFKLAVDGKSHSRRSHCAEFQRLG